MNTLKGLYPDHEPNIAFYNAEVEDEPACVMVDLDLEEYAPVEGYEYICVVKVLAAEGASINGDKIGRLDEKLTEHLAEAYGAVWAGSLNWDDEVHIFYYLTEEIDQREILQSSPVKSSKYDCIVEIAPEPEWDTYLALLYPDDYGRLEIENRELLGEAQDDGDDFSRARMVTHMSLFDRKADLQAFCTEVERMGFRIVTQEETPEADGDFPYSVEDAKVHTLIDIPKITLELLELTLAHNGYYDGWLNSSDVDTDNL